MILNYDEIDEAEYHRHPALSVTTADLGHAAHKHALGVGDELVDISTDLRTKAAREAVADA